MKTLSEVYSKYKWCQGRSFKKNGRSVRYSREADACCLSGACTIIGETSSVAQITLFNRLLDYIFKKYKYHSVIGFNDQHLKNRQALNKFIKEFEKES